MMHTHYFFSFSRFKNFPQNTGLGRRSPLATTSDLKNKSSAVAEMGDRLAIIDIDQKEGAAVPLSGGELDPHPTQCGLGRGLPPYQVASWYIQPFDHNRHGGCPPLGGVGSPSNTLSSGPRSTSLPMPYGSIQAFGHNRHGPKIVGAAAELSPHLTMWPGPRPNSVLSGILIHAAVWPQQTWAENGELCPFCFLGRGLGPHLTQCRLGRGLSPYHVAS